MKIKEKIFKILLILFSNAWRNMSKNIKNDDESIKFTKEMMEGIKEDQAINLLLFVTSTYYNVNILAERERLAKFSGHTTYIDFINHTKKLLEISSTYSQKLRSGISNVKVNAKESVPDAYDESIKSINKQKPSSDVSAQKKISRKERRRKYYRNVIKNRKDKQNG